MRLFTSFRSKLHLLLISVVIIITLIMGISQYLSVNKNYEVMDDQRRALLEENILKLMKATDSVYQMFEAPIEKQSLSLLEKMVGDYQKSGISGVNLLDYYDEDNGLNLYIIDSNNTVIASTYEPDIGLDFSEFEGVADFLDRIRADGKFFSDRLSLSSLENRVMKYSYLPTPDGLYIFETGIEINRENAIPEVLRFGEFGDIVSKNNGFVLSAQLFSKDGLTFNEDVSEVKSIDPSYEKYFKQAMEKMAPVTFEGTFNKQTATIKYLPFSFDNADDFHRHTVIELIYSNSDLRESEQQVIFLMLLTALAGSGLVAVFAFRMSKLLTSPINALYDSMQRISQGDYDSRLIVKSNDEFSAIAKQFNEMTEKIKTSMIDQQQKKQQIEALYKTEASMNKKLQEMMESTKQSYFETIKSLANAEEEKDIYTRGHCDRVTDYSLQIGKVIGLSVQDMDALRFGAILHDIGKIGIPEQILNKESPLPTRNSL